MVDRVERAEEQGKQQHAEACRWRTKYREAKTELEGTRKQQEVSAGAIKKAVRAAHGEMVLELAKVQSALHDARKAVIRSHHESSERHRMAVAAREIVAELARLKFALRESEAQCTALSSRLKRLEERADSVSIES